MELLRQVDKDLQVELFDLRDFFDKPSLLKRALLNFDFIWVCGGNTFVLRQSMRLSGFDATLQELHANKSDKLYGGYSAGVSVLGPTLKGIHIMDDVSHQPYGKREVIWDGLGLIDYTIVPHFELDHPEASSAAEAVAYMQENGIQYRALRDGEAIVIA